MRLSSLFIVGALLCTRCAAQEAAATPDSESVRSDAVGLTKDVLHDQKDIWTSPFHMSRDNAGMWLLAGAATAALIASDHPMLQALPHQGSVKSNGANISDLGQYYSVYPMAGALYGAGWLRHDEKMRDTGFLSGEALIDADIAVLVLKVAARRERPYEGDGGGHFEKGGSSFPSAHSTQAWALASVIAHEYGDDHKWVPFVAYTYASGISLARILAQDHFASDVFVGGAIGYFVGRYVTHHGGRHLKHVPALRSDLSAGNQTVELAWNY
jgi:PAP2 superfamily protein